LSRSGQKELPSKYLYDNLGSALFDAITLLPEYGLTRADERILQRHARDIAKYIPHRTMVSELGSGSGRKTRPILNALRTRGPLSYYAIEISSAALASCEMELRDIESVSIVGVESEYLAGLAEVAERRDADTHLFVLFLGSTIGNFDAGADARFLREVRNKLRAGDSLLLGTDLIKPREQLIDAYHDPRGVTAAFNLNLLTRINRELGGHFDVAKFAHRAFFNEEASRIEMHLVSRERQSVSIDALRLDVHVEAGETIHTENSYKYTDGDIDTLAREGGFDVQQRWRDAGRSFTDVLMVAR
jgi:dimethylhistidine N-methyltransferase